MNVSQKFLGFDLGAGSGRAFLGLFDGDRLSLQEIHRFPNVPVEIAGSLHWDVGRLFLEIKKGMSLAATKYGKAIDGIGVDSWGVDFALLTEEGELAGQPYHHRDKLTREILPVALERLSREEIFRTTGLPSLHFYSLFQLFAMARAGVPALKKARTFLSMANLFHHFLGGSRVEEFTMATTTLAYDITKRTWARELLGKLNLPEEIFPEVVPAGTQIGQLLPSIADEVGLGRLPIISPACHDSASATVTVPLSKDHFAYISSGTWSVVGTELPAPLLAKEVLDGNFSNQGAPGGNVMFVRNASGLWALQELRREWCEEGLDLSYADLIAQAARARPFGAVLDLDDPGLFSPGSMEEKVRAWCERTGQNPPMTHGEFVRCVLESLALKHRQCVRGIAKFHPRPLRSLRIVGGGSQNALLCQFTANALGIPVVAGPAEATAAGNILMQLVGSGALGSVEDAREVAKRSFESEQFHPREPTAWDEADGRFQKVLALAGGK